MDVFSTASAIAFFIDLYQKGIISKKDTNGLALGFGNKDLFLSLIDQTAKREGIGNMIAEGTHDAAKKIGRGAEKHALTVKKLELPNFSFCEPGNALGTAGSERGGWFRSYGFAITIAEAFPEQGRPLLKGLLGTEQLPDVDYEWMPQVLTYFEQAAGAADLVGICSWVTPRSLGPVGLDTMSGLVSAATGLHIDANSLRVYVQRQQDACRAFNMREGITREDDRPPEQFFEAPKQRPPRDGSVLDREKFEKMLSEYYRLKGWDPETGIPRRRERE
jgi:aldehyde:ferredoxin oxidoreductase